MSFHREGGIGIITRGECLQTKKRKFEWGEGARESEKTKFEFGCANRKKNLRWRGKGTSRKRREMWGIVPIWGERREKGIVSLE